MPTHTQFQDHPIVLYNSVKPGENLTCTKCLTESLPAYNLIDDQIYCMKCFSQFEFGKCSKCKINPLFYRAGLLMQPEICNDCILEKRENRKREIQIFQSELPMFLMVLQTQTSLFRHTRILTDEEFPTFFESLKNTPTEEHWYKMMTGYSHFLKPVYETIFPLFNHSQALQLDSLASAQTYALSTSLYHIFAMCIYDHHALINDLNAIGKDKLNYYRGINKTNILDCWTRGRYSSLFGPAKFTIIDPKCITCETVYNAKQSGSSIIPPMQCFVCARVACQTCVSKVKKCVSCDTDFSEIPPFNVFAQRMYLSYDH